VAVSTCPGALLRQVALEWELLVVLPWVQQNPLVAGLVVRAAGDGTEGAVDLEADLKVASSVNRATSSAPEGMTVAASAAAGGARMVSTGDD
jgi:hypothetical protein